MNEEKDLQKLLADRRTIFWPNMRINMSTSKKS